MIFRAHFIQSSHSRANCVVSRFVFFLVLDFGERVPSISLTICEKFSFSGSSCEAIRNELSASSFLPSPSSAAPLHAYALGHVGLSRVQCSESCNAFCHSPLWAYAELPVDNKDHMQVSGLKSGRPGMGWWMQGVFVTGGTGSIGGGAHCWSR